MQDLTQTLLDLPAAGLIPLGLLLLVGVVLWLAGRRVLRTGFAAVGLIVGGVLGWSASGAHVFESWHVPAWGVAAAAALILAIFAGAAYRAVLAASVGVLLAILAPMGVWTVDELGLVDFHTQPVEQEALATNPPLVDGIIDSAKEATEVKTVEPVLGAAETPEESPVWPTWIQRAAHDALVAVSQAWTESPPTLRWSLVAALAAGGLLGVVIGSAAPGFSASAVTALGGSLLLLGSGFTVATRLGVSESMIPSTSKAWLIIWLVVAVIGLGLQWMFRRKHADKPAD